MKFLCERCKCEFDAPRLETIYDDDFGMAQYRTQEIVQLCPECGSHEIIVGEECRFCGRLQDPIYLNDGACDECTERMEERLASCARDAFDPTEWEWIKWRFDLHEPTE